MRVAGNTTQARLEESVAGLLDEIRATFGESARLGEYAFLVEVEYEHEGAGANSVVFRCSDERPWVQAGLFRACERLAEGSYVVVGEG